MTYYDEISSGYDELHREEQLKKLRIIERELNLKDSDTILDVGCGSGLSAILLGKITGIDPSGELLKKALFKTIEGVAEDLPFDDNSFDVVISVTAIHNFANIEKGLKEMLRVGRDRFAFSILRKAELFQDIDKCIHKFFQVTKTIEEDKDRIYICKRNSFK